MQTYSILLMIEFSTPGTKKKKCAAASLVPNVKFNTAGTLLMNLSRAIDVHAELNSNAFFALK